MELRVQNLSKVYGRHKALDGVTFVLRRPGVYGYLGPNGAGKSTTFKILTGFLPPTTGEVYLDTLRLPHDRQQIQARIGYLPEHNPLYLDLYVREYLRFRGSLYGLRGADLRRRIEMVIERVGLTSHAHKLIGALSRGYRQRVGLAQAILHDPPLLILDEPTSGLDPNQVIEIRHLIQSLGQNHMVIFSSHILAEVQAIASEVLILHQGRLVLQTPLRELSQHLGQHTYVVEAAEPTFDWSFLPSGITCLAESDRIWCLKGPLDADIPRLVYQAALKQNIPILRLEKQQVPLEEVFQKLTT